MSTSHSFDTQLLTQAINQLRSALTLRDRPVPPSESVALPADLPQTGLGDSQSLDLLASTVLEHCAQLHHKGYFAHMDPPTPAVTWATALWQSAMNQNVLHPDVAPSARALETHVINWLAPVFGMDSGHMVPGATVSNITALWVARDLTGIKRVIASDRAHLSIKKAARLLGIEYQAVASNTQHQLDPASLGDCSDAAVVLTAGTVACGAIDPLAQLTEAPLAQAAWRHVDAAWAGPLQLTSKHQHLLNGITEADSIGFSAHKWLYQPKGAAVVLFKDYARALEPLSFGGGYLAQPNIGLVGSAPATALPLAATLLSYGRTGIASRIEADMQKAMDLARLIDADDRFDLWREPVSGVVVFRPRATDSRALRERLTDAWLSLVDIDGAVWLRAVAANPHANVHHVFERTIDAL